MSDKKSKQHLNEIRLSWSGKLLFASIAARLAAAGMRKVAAGMSEQTEEDEGLAGFPFKLQGTPEQLAAMTEVIRASKEYQEELKRDGATVETVMEKLNAQNVAKKSFEEKTGKAWPL